MLSQDCAPDGVSGKWCYSCESGLALWEDLIHFFDQILYLVNEGTWKWTRMIGDVY